MVAAADTGTVPRRDAQAMVDAIWSELGLAYPPKVERLPRQARRLQADGSRLRLRLPELIPSWLLLHEVAHSLSSTADGVSDGHGPTFMGLYVQLLARYLRLPSAHLIQSAIDAGIAIHPAARPSFVSPQPLPLSRRGTISATSGTKAITAIARMRTTRKGSIRRAAASTELPATAEAT